jgi:hypothetical protein
MSRSCGDHHAQPTKGCVFVYWPPFFALRPMTPVSYDVNKDGIKVAVLTFPKSAYRLGETVLGVVELNAREGRAKVLQVSLFVYFKCFPLLLSFLSIHAYR